MSFNLVKTSSAGNLYAVAHFGYLAVYPNSSCILISLTLITTPSISYGNLLLFSVMSSINFKIPSISLTNLFAGFTLKPKLFINSSDSICVLILNLSGSGK